MYFSKANKRFNISKAKVYYIMDALTKILQHENVFSNNVEKRHHENMPNFEPLQPHFYIV